MLLPLCLLVFCREFQCLCVTFAYAFAAAYTFGTVGYPCGVNIHFAHSGTFAAADTFALVTSELKNGNFIEGTVNCPERTDVFAEGSVNYQRSYYQYRKNGKLIGIKPSY